MYLKMPSTSNEVFYNFVIEEKNNDLRYVVNRYITTNDWLDNQQQTFQGNITTFTLTTTESNSGIKLTHFSEIDDIPAGGGGGSSINNNDLMQQYPHNCNGTLQTVIVYEPKMCSQNVHWPWTPTFNNPCYASLQARYIQTTYYRCIAQTTGVGTGPGSNNPNNPGSGGSGSSSGPNTGISNPSSVGGGPSSITAIVAPIEDEKKPCEELAEKDADPVFSAKMAELKTKAGAQNFESAHVLYQNPTSGLNVGDEFTGESNVNGEGREVYLSLNANGANSIGFMHCHLDNGTTLKVFSLDDIIALALIAELSTRPTNEFAVYVTTNSGTLALKINNKALLTSKIDLLDMTYNAQEREFSNNVKKEQTYLKQKLGLVKFLSNMPLLGSIGLDLYEKVGNNWNKLGLSADGNSIINTPCNQ